MLSGLLKLGARFNVEKTSGEKWLQFKFGLHMYYYSIHIFVDHLDTWVEADLGYPKPKPTRIPSMHFNPGPTLYSDFFRPGHASSSLAFNYIASQFPSLMAEQFQNDYVRWKKKKKQKERKRLDWKGGIKPLKGLDAIDLRSHLFHPFFNIFHHHPFLELGHYQMRHASHLCTPIVLTTNYQVLVCVLITSLLKSSHYAINLIVLPHLTREAGPANRIGSYRETDLTSGLP